ncbi:MULTISPECIES: VOC family protein [unclassified Bacillus (in: firmicutes)]|uniref:VOC family protein n=1 Tax=unclassified Bacillus (in: firmicutes) TaxID=185979 RepID=UPI0008E83F51|nr:MULTISPECIES: VOC family protein [unclassified Bacillus (in: firmicutes)]SFJ78466.1 Catechol 2,3-dioxygenase [Bacillus sp. 71mf]SFS99009.1 Catechol 2,3-dioxygenase [Bacillus sp. 103mf]
MGHSVVLEVRDLKKTLYFYEGILGFRPSRERPQLDVPGVWYDAGEMRICCVLNRDKEATQCEKIFPEIEVNIQSHDAEKLLKKLGYYQVIYTELEDYIEKKKVISIYDPDGHIIQLQSQYESGDSLS